MKKYTKDTWITFITQGIILIIGFAYNILIARLLGPEGKGIVTIACLFPFIFAVIIGLGLDEGSIYIIAKNKDNHGPMFSNLLLASIIMSLLSFLFLYFCQDFLLANVLKNVNRNYFILISISIPFFIFLHNARAMFQGHSDFVRFNSLFILQNGANLILGAFLIIKFGVLGAIVGFFISVVIASITSQVWLLKYGRPRNFNFTLLKSGLWFGVRNKAGFVIDFVNKRLGVFIVNYFIGSREVGYYAMAISFAEILYKLPEAFGMTLFPRTAQLSKEKGNEITSLILRNVLFFMFSCGFLFAFIIKPLIFITVGKSFYPSLIPFLILLPGIIFMGITRIITSNFQGQGVPEYGTYLTAVSAVFTIALSLILIPTYKAVGAAIAATISYGISAVLSIIIFRIRSKIGLKAFLLLQKNPISEIKTILK